MAIKTTYTCDNCSGYIEKFNSAINLKLAVGFGYGSPSIEKKWMLCRTCSDNLRITPASEKEDQERVENIPAPTIEELIRLIVREEIDNE